jgi:hypothetical protein
MRNLAEMSRRVSERKQIYVLQADAIRGVMNNADGQKHRKDSRAL